MRKSVLFFDSDNMVTLKPNDQNMNRKMSQAGVGVVGGNAGGDGVPHFFSTGGRPPLSPLFWTEIRAKVSPLLQLVSYWDAV